MNLAVWLPLGAYSATILAFFSPWARRKRSEYADDRRTRREMHEALFGVKERRDDNGEIIRSAETGTFAEVRALRAELQQLRAEFPRNGRPYGVKADEILRRVSRLEAAQQEARTLLDHHISVMHMPQQRRPPRDQGV